MAFPKVGNKAPAFSLKDQNGDTVKLADFKGKKNVLLYFYPKAKTPGCTVQACGIRDTYAEFGKRNTVVLGVSPDPVAKLKKFEENPKKEEAALNFTLLSDEDHAVADKYGAWGPKKFMGKEFDGILRTSFIIDKDGVLRQVLDKFKTKDHHEVALAALDELGLN
ncbi:MULTISPECIES: thioredoxin-dependent thiol peroxidase [Spongiibacter]|uniref:thioredoxin-dependent thiol peroxidase n=1 Tax=Spongiibacter TaxID=630749 RepID=UPI0003B4C5E4|nr:MULTISPECIES: thioredoxin-dependent thiol peroxidase [Spongiibacter]MAY39329.1 thioredoxin-dependent thiol peroxidase [Spongiibacter sp.]MBO6752432.1 thioredoxin-dependent thiol peroxidase [Spongiibacter sp.]MBU72564.1 thioredoxin-dependent thiol peroxidase [Spongiibacter sp.]|tara:strand:- start:23883 stop:24377 length:495 start_codon:yes stop_codon:yes gene_type:complete